MPLLSLGFLAHVDAGKTSLTERVLHATGVIDAIGAVDAGTTQTDSLELEQQRGITIRAAVVSFPLGDLTVSLIDTPGHADFIAEVDRALSALDAVVIVVSAVEGVQPQTRKLVRAVRERGLPFLIFCNKMDRMGARFETLVEEIERKLEITTLPMTRPVDPGTPDVAVRAIPFDDLPLLDTLTAHDDDLLRAWMANGSRASSRALCRALRRQVAAGHVVPLYVGSAITGAGVGELLTGIRAWLPPSPEAVDAPLAGTIFTIRRSAHGEKLVLARLRGGSLAVRASIRGGAGDRRWHHRITGIDRFREGATVPADHATSGEIVQLHGLKEARVGDAIGAGEAVAASLFAPPTLESIVRPDDPAQAIAMYEALTALAEQDPLIGVTRDARDRTVSVRLFGEVQKEVVASMLAADFGIAATLEESRIIHTEAVIGTGEGIEILGRGSPWPCTVGIRVEPAASGTGVVIHRHNGELPLSFYAAIDETIHTTLAEGLYGWSVPDAIVTVTETAKTPGTAAGDFRKTTPLALMAALDRAGTQVREPVHRFELRLPMDLLGEVLAVLTGLRAVPEETIAGHDDAIVCGTIPAATMPRFERRLPGLTSGDGVWHAEFAGFSPVTGAPPRRPRSTVDPRNRKLYLAAMAQGAQ